MPSMPPTFRPAGYKTYTETRPTERARGYTKGWSKRSALYKQRHPLCLGCQAIGRVEPTTVTDHIVPHKGDTALLWDEANWQPSCRWHHDVIKQKLERLYFEGKATKSDLRLDSEMAKNLSRSDG